MDKPMLLHVRGEKDGYAELRPEIDEMVADLRKGESSDLMAKMTNPYPNIEMQT